MPKRNNDRNSGRYDLANQPTATLPLVSYLICYSCVEKTLKKCLKFANDRNCKIPNNGYLEATIFELSSNLKDTKQKSINPNYMDV